MARGTHWWTSPRDYLERKEVRELIARFLSTVPPREACAIKLYFARVLYGKNSRQAHDREQALIAYLGSENQCTIRTAIYRHALPKLRYYLWSAYAKGVDI
jgi:hypothetical protein